MRYSSEHRQETRQRVLDEATREIRAKGPASVAVAGIMARAGLTHGGFYAHFPSRDALIAEAIGAMFADARHNFDLIQAEDAAPAQALARYIRFYLSRSHRDARDSGCPLPALSSDLARLEPAAKARFGKGVAGLTARLSALIETMGVADADDVAASVLAEMVGAVALARAVEDVAQSDAILRRTRAALLARFALETIQ